MKKNIWIIFYIRYDQYWPGVALPQIHLVTMQNKNAPKESTSTGMCFLRQAVTHLKNLIISSKSIGGRTCRVSKLSVTESADFAFFRARLLANAMYDWTWVSSTGGGVSRLKHSQLQLNIWWQRPSKFWVTQLTIQVMAPIISEA
jgi:hypothetical protein